MSLHLGQGKESGGRITVEYGGDFGRGRVCAKS